MTAGISVLAHISQELDNWAASSASALDLTLLLSFLFSFLHNVSISFWLLLIRQFTKNISIICNYAFLLEFCLEGLLMFSICRVIIFISFGNSIISIFYFLLFFPHNLLERQWHIYIQSYYFNIHSCIGLFCCLSIFCRFYFE